MTTFVYRSVMAATPQEVFAFHERPDAFRLLTPWWSGAHVLQAAPDLQPGAQAIIRLGPPLVGRLWVAQHTIYKPPHEFVERQVSGPFGSWEHHHRILAHEGGALLSDEITYEAPGGPLSGLLDRLVLRPFLRRLFAYRHRVTRQALGQTGHWPVG